MLVYVLPMPLCHPRLDLEMELDVGLAQQLWCHLRNHTDSRLPVL